ncbi:MAG: RdgB/HAM1 family non-canonical purine NTP pyrophosphatase [Schleiferiaceae bacterium]|nr:RdgB/HAM1 family non-canonical purine NTP pyrophosphatase [Schleiferiaceae bacterium]
MQLIMASQNPNKIAEIAPFLPEAMTLQSLLDVGYTTELEETGTTLEQNASQKAWFVYRKFGTSCFADDTGLEVTALNGAPGVYSARYGGPERTAQKNIDRLLRELAPHTDRSAQFRTVISLIWNGVEHQFEGVVKGVILHEPVGIGGFGYDPIFQPDGDIRSFAQFSKAEKNAISHRGRALAKLLAFLKNH